MKYYKIPHATGSEFVCPAGSVPCCMFYCDGFLWCKFEKVVNAGSTWIETTEEEFEANCPQFPDNTSDPLSNDHFTLSPTDITAGSSALQTGKLYLVYE